MEKQQQQRGTGRGIYPVYLKLTKNTDADIIIKLQEVENKQGYIKSLIRADIKNEK